MLTLTNQERKQLKELHTSAGRKKAGLFLIEGEKAVQEAIAEKVPLHRLVCQEGYQDKYAHLFKTDGLPWAVASEAQMLSLSTVKTAPGVIAVLPITRYSFGEIGSKRLLAYFVGINDPGNLGTMIRTADWFGVEGIIISNDSVDPYNDKVVRSSMGSLLRMPLYEDDQPVQTLTTLRQQGTRLLATTLEGEPLAAIPSAPLCILMGSESHGLPAEVQELADIRYKIPGFGKAESLNVAVSFGITLSEVKSFNSSL